MRRHGLKMILPGNFVFEVAYHSNNTVSFHIVGNAPALKGVSDMYKAVEVAKLAYPEAQFKVYNKINWPVSKEDFVPSEETIDLVELGI